MKGNFSRDFLERSLRKKYINLLNLSLNEFGPIDDQLEFGDNSRNNSRKFSNTQSKNSLEVQACTTDTRNKASIESFSVFSLGPSVATGTGGHRNVKSIQSACGRYNYHLRFVEFLQEDKKNSKAYNKSLYKFLRRNLI